MLCRLLHIFFANRTACCLSERATNLGLRFDNGEAEVFSLCRVRMLINQKVFQNKMSFAARFNGPPHFRQCAQNRTPSPSTRAPKKARYLIRWGFKPKVLGYVPNVRGAVTGVP